MHTVGGECVCVGEVGTEGQKNSSQKTGSATRFNQIISVFDFFSFSRNFLGARFSVTTFSPVGNKVKPDDSRIRNGTAHVLIQSQTVLFLKCRWVQIAGNANECVSKTQTAVPQWRSVDSCICRLMTFNAQEGPVRLTPVCLCTRGTCTFKYWMET